MRAFVLGTAGHVDHGKTALVKALTGVDTDRWKEEKERGLTIDIGFARLDLSPDLEVGVIDVPGHEGFVKNMLAGSTGIDLLLLVVAADEGPMPQTREHLMIARLLGVSLGVVALTKVDRVDAEWRDLARDSVREECARLLGHEEWPIVDVSSVTGEGLVELRETMRTIAEALPQRPASDYFRMPVDRSFSVKGAGPVVTGTSWSGELAVGDVVRVLPAGMSARVRSLEVHGSRRNRVGPGQRCAMALVGIEPSDARRGAVVVREDAWRAVSRLGAWVELPRESPRSIEHGQRLRLFLGTGETFARALLPRSDRLVAGESTWALLECERPIVARVRDRFILRFYSPVVTVGGGRVAELDAPMRWRDRAEAWEKCLAGHPATTLEAVVEMGGGQGVSDAELPLRTGLPARSLEEADGTTAAVVRLGGRCYARHFLTAARRDVVQALEKAHRVNRRASAASLESLRARLASPYSEELLSAAVAELVSEDRVLLNGPWIRLPGHTVDLTSEEAAQLGQLLETLKQAGLEPPTPDALGRSLGLDRQLLNDLLRLLVERGEIVAVTPEMYLATTVESAARVAARRVIDVAGTATPADFRERFGVSRKYLIPLLEHLDRIGLTRRTDDGRVLAD